MSNPILRRGLAVAGAAAFIASAYAGAAQAESMHSQCSDKYNALQKANQLNGQSWSQFYKSCKAELKTEKKTEKSERKEEKAEKKAHKEAPSAMPAAAPSAPAAPAPRMTHEKTAAPSGPAPVATGPVVYPNAISPQFANLSAGKARFKTCDAQYQANKATNSNGGLKWIEKGGGYYSLCNKHLKGE
jgi:hypothetical protein